MIISNLLTNFGLVNRTIGTLHGIVKQPGTDFYTTLPCMLLFTADQYIEDYCYLFQNNNNRPVVLLPLITWTWDNESCKHFQTIFPVVLAYVITIHKSQGLTLKQMVIDISKRDF